jgi:hypothetical protein
LTLSSLTLVLAACNSGSSGGGGGSGADGEAALAALGFAPGDLADLAAGTMAVSLDWLSNDGIVPTGRFGPCPTFLPGTDDDTNGHPDTVEIVFDCTTLEGLVIAGTIFLSEYAVPADFLGGQCTDFLAGAGSPDWGMQGSFFLTIQEPGNPSFGMNGTIEFAEFPALGQLAIEIHTSILAYPVDGGDTFLVETNVCATLPTDDSSDFAAGFVETFVHDPKFAEAILVLECELLPNGTVAFEAFGGLELLASGLINLAAGDGDEVTFD